VSFDLHSNVAHHKLEQAVLECGEAKYCHIQLHQGTKVKAHQPIHNRRCVEVISRAAVTTDSHFHIALVAIDTGMHDCSQLSL